MNYEIKSAKQASFQEIFRDKNNNKKLSFKNEAGLVREILDEEDLTTLSNSISAKEDVANKQTDLTASATKYPTVNAVNTGLGLKQDSTSATTGAVISFATSQVYNTPASPSASNITDNLTGAKIGIVQKIYHNHSVAPTVPAGWVLLGSGTYTTSVLNVIYAEWVSSTRVEYWIVQPA